LITPRSYAAKFAKSQIDLSKRLGKYLKKANEENVHDLRTSIRRFLASSDLLPRSLRTRGRSKTVIKDYGKLLRLNANVRDLDIVLSKLSADRSNPASNALMGDLSEARRSSLKRARRFASSVKDSQTISVRARDIGSSTLRKRFRKVVARLVGRIEKRLPVVLKEPENKNELHQLREDSRRLRYTLELDPKESSNLQVLQSWQEVLGDIHDADIFMSHFYNNSKDDSHKIEGLLQREATARNENYEKFRAMAKETPDFRLES
jgi:CHAD domain-containing protein